MFAGRLASLEAGLPPMGEVGLLSVADKETSSTGRMQQTSCQSIRTHGRLIPRASRIAKTKTPASGLRQALLGRIRFGKTPSLGYVRRQKGRRVAKSVTVITTWIIATGSEQKFRLNSILVCLVPRG